MRAIKLEISLKKTKKKINRTVLVFKKMSYQQLHEVIQLLFNLDCCEDYAFIYNTNKVKDYHKTLLRVKENDVIQYHYDLVDPLFFDCVVKEIVDSDEVKCISFHGKNLYESVRGELLVKYQSDFDIEWVNQCLKAYSVDDDRTYLRRVKEVLEKLTQIRFFQDYMHNQIVQIELPQKRFVYMGCDASQDVVLNFHINSNKLIEYTSVNPSSPAQSIIKYHDCIELALIKRGRNDDLNDFDFNVSSYGAFLSYTDILNKEEELLSFQKEIYLFALKQYVKVMEFCAQNNMKYQQGKMMKMDLKGQIEQVDGRMTVIDLQPFEDEMLSVICTQFPQNEESVEADVLSLIRENGEVETLAIVGNMKTGYAVNTLKNHSVKTMVVMLMEMFCERWQKNGRDKIVVMRDENLLKVFRQMGEKLNVCFEKRNKLDLDDEFLPEKRPSLEDMNPKDIILRLLEELGIDVDDFERIEIKDEDLKKKIKLLKDEKKYS